MLEHGAAVDAGGLAVRDVDLVGGPVERVARRSGLLLDPVRPGHDAVGVRVAARVGGKPRHAVGAAGVRIDPVGRPGQAVAGVAVGQRRVRRGLDKVDAARGVPLRAADGLARPGEQAAGVRARAVGVEHHLVARPVPGRGERVPAVGGVGPAVVYAVPLDDLPVGHGHVEAVAVGVGVAGVGAHAVRLARQLALGGLGLLRADARPLRQGQGRQAHPDGEHRRHERRRRLGGEPSPRYGRHAGLLPLRRAANARPPLSRRRSTTPISSTWSCSW